MRPSLALVTAFLGWFAPALWGETLPIEEWPVAWGRPRFGEQPFIRGHIVVWRRYSPDGWRPDTIEFQDISRNNGPIVTVTGYPASSTGVFLGPTHLFWGNPWLPPVRARPIDRLNVIENLVVCDSGQVVAATTEFVFIVEGGWMGGRYLAMPIADIGKSPPQSPRLVTEFLRRPAMSRCEDASADYFVWQEADPEKPGDTYKIYRKRIDRLFVEGDREFLLDTGIAGGRPIGSFVDLEGKWLAYQSARPTEPAPSRDLYLLNLESRGNPILVAEGRTDESIPDWPSLSTEYLTWTELVDFFGRRLYGIALKDGLPVGERFLVSADPGASWSIMDRNIVVWNGSTRFVGGEATHMAVMAAELPTTSGGEGDVDQDGKVNVTDAILILNHLFLGGWQPRRRLADVDRSGSIGISDAFVILRHLFVGGPLF